MEEKTWKNYFFNFILQGEGKTFIDSFLNAFCDVNALKTDGHTVLSNASEYGNLEIVKYLVQKGADINVKNVDGSRPLHIAAKFGHEDIVEFFYSLCKNKRDLNVQTGNRDTPLLLAAKNRHKVTAEFLINSDADFERCAADDKWTVLHYACIHGWLDIVQSLVNRKCNLNVMSHGMTPLLLAAMYQKRKVVALLIESGADVNCRNNNHYKWTVLHYACDEGWVDIVQSLVNRKCNLNIKTIDGKTPLLLAKKMARTDVIVLLVESGADVKQWIPDFKESVLHYVSSPKLLEVLKALIKSGIYFNIAKSRGEKHLQIACSKESSEIMNELLEEGVNWNVKNEDIVTSFNYRINLTPSVGVIRLLAKNGAYFERSNLLKIYKNALLKNPILQDVELCTQSLINKFNNKDLLEVYKLYACSERLPPIERLKITHWQSVTREIEKSVENDVSTTGYFNLKEACPTVLKMLSVKALTDYCHLKIKRSFDIDKRKQIKKRRLN